MNLAYTLEEVVKAAESSFDMSGDDAETLLNNFCRANRLNQRAYLEGLGDLDFADTVEFKQWFKSWVEEQLDDVVHEIDDHFEDGYIHLFRVITAPRGWTPDPDRHPGLYWSWDFQAAQAHWGDFRNGNIEWILETKVVSGVIDWPKSLAMNINPCYHGEKEIRLLDGTSVELIDYSEDWRKPHTRHWKKKK